MNLWWCPTCKKARCHEGSECGSCQIHSQLLEEGRQQEAEDFQKERDRQEEEWQERMDKSMQESEEETETGGNLGIYPSGAAGIFSTDNPQSDAQQIRAEKG